MIDMKQESNVIFTVGLIMTLIFGAIWTVEEWGVWHVSTFEIILMGLILMIFGMILKLASRSR